MHSTSPVPLESLSGLVTKVRSWGPTQPGTEELSPEGPTHSSESLLVTFVPCGTY